MQEGIRIKSKDIFFVISIFYLAINFFIDIFEIAKKLNLKKLFNSRLIYLLAFKIERACSIPTASS